MSIEPVICDMPNCATHGCIFCRIIKRDEPARIVDESQYAISFLPMRMATKGHVLVIPKTHARDFFEADPVDVADALKLGKRVALKMRTALNCAGLNLIQSSGSCATQTVHHIHFHLVPRWESDRFGPLWPKSMRLDDEKLDAIAKHIHEGTPLR